MSSSNLRSAFIAQWREMRLKLREIEARVSVVEKRERAEVAASVPVYDDVGDLPAAGQRGRVASVGSAPSDLYFDNGSSWEQVT